jgi:hypothetical protein
LITIWPDSLRGEDLPGGLFTAGDFMSPLAVADGGS